MQFILFHITLQIISSGNCTLYLQLYEGWAPVMNKVSADYPPSTLPRSHCTKKQFGKEKKKRFRSFHMEMINTITTLVDAQIEKHQTRKTSNYADELHISKIKRMVQQEFRI